MFAFKYMYTWNLYDLSQIGKIQGRFLTAAENSSTPAVALIQL